MTRIDPGGIEWKEEHASFHRNGCTEMRPLTVAEKNILRLLFGSSLNVDAIGIGSSIHNRPWSPYGNRISLPDRFFKDADERDELALVDPFVLSVFAHEALHVWQRQHGEWVTMAAALLQLGDLLSIYDPYRYDHSITDPIAMLAEFETGSVEQQGRIFQDLVYDLRKGKDTTRYCRVWDYVRKRGT